MALLVWPVVIPLAAALLASARPGIQRPLALLAAPVTVIMVAAVAGQLAAEGPLRYAIGGWPAPAGIGLTADSLGGLFLVMTSVVAAPATLYAAYYWRPEPDSRERAFWPLWWGLWAGLNALFLTGDIFNAYVALEVIALAAVALVALTGSGPALRAALRYLLVSLVASMLYLLGVALLYADTGVLDMALLAERITPGPTAAAALATITTGLALKTALFPLHFWLPPAHSHAPGPVSAVLSALVVKAGFYLTLRFWFEIFDGVDVLAGAQLVGALGGVAVIWGSLQALAAQRLKGLVAYSTVAQLGYLFLAFPLMATAATEVLAREAALYLALSHGLAKGAAFLAAGTLLWATGTDSMARMGSILPRFPVTAAAFALAGINLMGMPPTGGFVGKYLLVEGMIAGGYWGGLAIIAAGSFLAAGYVFRVLVHIFRDPADPEPLASLRRTPDPRMEWTALALALSAVVMGFLAPVLEPVLQATGSAL